MGLSAAAAQTAAVAGPAFEVATVKPSAAESSNSNINFREGSFTTQNVSLQSILQIAYDLRSGTEDRMAGGPSWVRSAAFDIDAKEDDALAARLEKMPPEERSATLRVMIQKLLADRFDLRVHFETKQLPVNALIVTRRGSKLKPAADATVSGEPGDSKGEAPPHWKGGLHNDGHGNMEGKGATLDMLANVLGAQPELGGRTVVNETGMSGKYDFLLKWTPDSAVAAPSGKDSSDAAGPSLFTALEEQLGLKIESRKEPVPVLVIDHVERPSAN